MPIAYNWVQYSNVSPFNIIEDDLPSLDFGTIAPNSPYAVFVVGLKFQGSSVSNISIWMDDDKADIYPQNNPVPSLRQDVVVRGFDIRAVLIDQTNPTVFNQDPSTWPELPSPSRGNTVRDSIVIGSATMNMQMVAYSPLLALAIKVPANEPNEDLRNFRILATWDTTDS